MQVAELAGEVADAVRGRQRRDRHRAEDAERTAALVEEAAAGVARNARCGRVDRVGPAAAVGAETLALLRAEGGDAEPQRRVAVAEHVLAECRGAAESGRAAPV